MLWWISYLLFYEDIHSVCMAYIASSSEDVEQTGHSSYSSLSPFMSTEISQITHKFRDYRSKLQRTAAQISHLRSDRTQSCQSAVIILNGFTLNQCFLRFLIFILCNYLLGICCLVLYFHKWLQPIGSILQGLKWEVCYQDYNLNLWYTTAPLWTPSKIQGETWFHLTAIIGNFFV